MHVPEHPSPTLHNGVCASCKQPPGHPADREALALGYEWTTRDPLPGLEPAFYICAACVHEQAHATLAAAEAAGYVRAPLGCCA